MRYTLGQAAKRLGASVGAYGITDVRDAVNHAVESLAGMSGWECLRQVFRISSVGPCFTLPQGSAGLVRACVNGRPSTVRGQDFRFLQSGPGDIDFDRPPFGFAKVGAKNILDLGFRPVAFDPEGPFRLFAIADGDDDQPPLVVRGVNAGGRAVSVTVPVHGKAVYDGLGTKISGMEPDEAVPDDTEFGVVSEVVLDVNAGSYVTLYAVDTETSERFPIAVYHPEVKVPQFRRYSISGIGPGQPIDILVEVRIEPLPLIRDSDPLPFDGLDPIEWVIRADWCMKSGEVYSAQKYTNQAVQWMKAKEVANDTIQTPIVVNSLFDGSMGEISRDAFNV